MARYCFYCNRELKAGERCTCRIATANQAAQADAAYQDQADQNTNTDKKKTRREDAKKRKAEKVHIKQERRQARSKNINSSEWKVAILNFFKNISRSITKPTSFIQDASYPSLITMATSQLVEAFLLALVVMRLLTLSNIGNLLAFGANDVGRNFTYPERMFLFAKLFLVAIVFFILRLLIVNLILRFIGRKQLTLLNTTQILTPGSIYYVLFLIVGYFLSSGSGIQTLLIIIAGYGVRILIDHLAIRMDTGLSEDHMIRITLLTFLITALVLGGFISVLAPNLSDFRVNIPGQFT